MVHPQPSIWKVHKTVKKRRQSGGVELPQEAVQVPQPLRPRRVLERLVLGKDVDESLPEVVAVLPQDLAAPPAEAIDHFADPGVRAEGVRHSGAARPS